MTTDDPIQLDPPLHLIVGETTCWQCAASMPVVAILCESAIVEDEGAFILSHSTELPDELSLHLQNFYPNFRRQFSRTFGGEYFANNCPKCGMITGDFFLHSDPGGPFFPMEPEDAQRLTIEQMPIEHAISIRADRCYGSADRILKHAKRTDNSRR